MLGSVHREVAHSRAKDVSSDICAVLDNDHCFAKAHLPAVRDATECT